MSQVLNKFKNDIKQTNNIYKLSASRAEQSKRKKKRCLTVKTDNDKCSKELLLIGTTQNKVVIFSDYGGNNHANDTYLGEPWNNNRC